MIMRNVIQILLLVAAGIYVCTFSSSCAARKSEPLQEKLFVPKNQRIANGQIMFMANCQKCHPGGEGGLGPSILPNPAPQFIKRFQMRHGLGAMPGFRVKEISRKDLHDISKYLVAWKHY
jgi:mono/diheme cytochrome c family protein